jgi:Thioredoxin-like
MRLRLIPFLLLASASCVLSGALPLTVKEVSLMLRSGYSSDAVLREIAARHFADPVDPATEKQLVQAGAMPPLVEALRSGKYQASPSEVAAAKEKLAAQAESATEVVEQTREVNLAREENLESRASVQVQKGGPIYEHLKDDLVYWHQGSLQHFDDEALEDKKFYLFFFSAIGSREGLKFTHRLIDYYNRVSPQHPEFEVIFFSADRSPFAMENYIGGTNMPWPAVAYDKRSGKAGAIQNGLVRTIPCLILADASGKILSRSDTDGGLDKVLMALNGVLVSGNSSFTGTSNR